MDGAKRMLVTLGGEVQNESGKKYFRSFTKC